MMKKKYKLKWQKFALCFQAVLHPRFISITKGTPYLCFTRQIKRRFVHLFIPDLSRQFGRGLTESHPNQRIPGFKDSACIATASRGLQMARHEGVYQLQQFKNNGHFSNIAGVDEYCCWNAFTCLHMIKMWQQIKRPRSSFHKSHRRRLRYFKCSRYPAELKLVSFRQPLSDLSFVVPDSVKCPHLRHPVHLQRVPRLHHILAAVQHCWSSAAWSEIPQVRGQNHWGETGCECGQQQEPVPGADRRWASIQLGELEDQLRQQPEGVPGLISSRK